MINQKEVTINWINKVSKENNNVDKILAEKAIRALLLLEGLVKQEISFVFKGGTALMLHFNSTKRLSIDIDIVLPIKNDDFENKLDALAKEQGFIRKELTNRNVRSIIKKEHYKFYYVPVHKSNMEEDYILLDVLFENPNYQKIKRKRCI